MRDDWRAGALCAQTDPEAFFPAPTQTAHAALRICARCEVRAECLADAIEVGDEHGVRGGVSASRRKRMAADRRRCSDNDTTSAA